MKNTSAYAVLTRFGIIAAILATLVLIAPAVSAADPLEFDYPEKGTHSIATFGADDEDEGAVDVDWSLDGVDKGAFNISDDGELTFDKSPNFESPTDADEDTAASGDQGKGDNVYKVTVVATSDTKTELKVEVTVTDIEEDGEVTFNQPQPQATRGLVASVSDGDGEITDRQWQWSRCTTDDNPDDCTDIEGATSASRSPVAADVGYYLRATVTYTDRRGPDKTASDATDNTVEARTLFNAAPSFGDIDPIPVDENVKGNIGDPIVANDADNDVLLYSLDAAYDVNAGTDGAQNDNGLFEMSKDGQLSLKAVLNYESPGNDPATGAARVANADATDDIPDGVFVYSVGIKALDPSGAPGTGVVMVYLSDVNEAPKFSDATEAGDTGHPTNADKLYITENLTSATTPELALRSTEAVVPDTDTAETISYSAEDNDGTTKDTAVSYKVEGADAKYFEFADAAVGTLTPTTELSAEGKGANFEKKPSYSITIVASTTGQGGDGNNPTSVTMYGRLDVTVMVVDAEDPGEVTLSARQSQVDIPVIAKLSDPDGDETAVTWKWFRGSSTTPILSDAGVLDTTADTECDADASPAVIGSATVVCRIGGQTSALYTPGDDDVGLIIHAVANYKDGQGTVAENALGSSEASVQASNPANTAPKFPDQDLNTPGVQNTMAKRSVPENFEGKVGEPIGAVDADVDKPEGNMELLTYTIDDEDNFSVDRKTGQISTAVELDYETQSVYTVILTATDPSGARAEITVMIEVTDEDDPPTIQLLVAPEFADDQMTEFSVDENSPEGMAVGDPVVATDENGDELTYSLSGDDAMYFDIDDMGQITVGEGTMLDYESDKMSYSVTVTADDGTGRSDMIDVTIMVNDVEEAPTFTALQTELGMETVELSVDENTEAGTAVGDPVVATDSDGDELTYSLDEMGDMYFDIDSATGQISTEAALDHEAMASHELTVTADDGTGLSDSIGVSITVNDVNEAPMFDAATAERMIDENMDAGTAVGDPVAAMDEDGDELMYTISESMYFEIDAMSGQISTTAALDYEAMASHEVTVTASDGELTAEVMVTVMVGDVEESPCVIGGAVSGTVDGLDMDCETLLDIRDGLVGDGTALNWSAETPIDEWDGVASHGGTDRVYSIYLRGHGLAGMIPAGISGLDALERLQLHDNDLTGGIPDLSALDNLEILNLKGNMLSGEIPATLGDMDSIDYLWLYENNLTGSIPAELGSATTLRQIRLHRNDLSGEIPSSL
ncbi:MAG: cadherin domain-containing protein, partial [Chloroflexota bacterium]|nr:cadherin domain-containing protein [Chloroflexota bacterium]